MATEAKPNLGPKLRFPEFQQGEPWKQRRLSEITPSIFDGTHQTPTYTTEGVPFYSVENLISGNANKFISREDYELATKKNKPEQGDILITRIGKIGHSQVVTWSHEFSIYVTLAVIKQGPLFNSHFLHHFMQSAIYQKEILSKSLLNAVPCKINMDSLRATHVFLAGLAEQQKIAECLSTLDELIGGESQKLDALKAHKKGLMQQLFPRAGETLPRLRFPEFQNAPEWELKALDSVARLRNGYAFKSGEYVGRGAFRIITIANVQQGALNLTSTKTLPALPSDIQPHQILQVGDILISMTGNVGRVCRVTSEGLLLNQRVGKLIPHAVVQNYFYQHLQRDDFRSGMQLKAAGGAQGNLSSGDISDYVLRVPKERNEQHRIGSCLSSLDELTAAQSEKLEALKTHKKGLMQQLFPSLGGAE